MAQPSDTIADSKGGGEESRGPAAGFGHGRTRPDRTHAGLGQGRRRDARTASAHAAASCRLGPAPPVQQQRRGASVTPRGRHAQDVVLPPGSRVRAAVRRVRHNSLLRNSILLMAITLLNSTLGYGYWILAARLLSAPDVGLGAALLSASTLASILSNMGISAVLTNVLPKRARGREWSATFSAGLAGSLLTGLAGAGIGLAVLLACPTGLSAALHHPVYALVFVLNVPIWTLTVALDGVFLAERTVQHSLARNATSALAKPLLLVAAQGARELAVLASSTLASLLSVLAGLALVVRLRPDYRPAAHGVLRQLRTHARPALGQHLITVGGLGPSLLMPVLVATRLSVAANAYFYTAWMLGGIFLIVSPAVSSSLFAEGSHSSTDLASMAASCARYIAAILLPIMVVTFVGGRYLLAVFGPEYARQGTALLRVLVLSAIPDAITNVYVASLRVRGQLSQAALLNLGMAALAILLTWFLLPVLGIVAAGWAWLVAQTAGSIYVGVEAARRRRPGTPQAPS